MPIGGNRHSAGGTLFTGADGTRFEAEQGELIGVMNRNAAAHFMAFNNAFPAGGGNAPNYFAGGGIVSREIASPGLNTDELAAKIAQANRSIPAPVVAVQDIITQGNSYVQVRDAATALPAVADAPAEVVPGPQILSSVPSAAWRSANQTVTWPSWMLPATW